jgi:aspartyl-tRNA(Asn)/glutamyl-tRNA(Gln) amidotransferase subunit B
MDQPYDIIIGLEVHVQLLTASKMFCGCSTTFGAPPNTQTCPVCIGMPGTLPVMNRRAFELSLRAATALDCEIAPFTKWDRKNYYYPDLPKGYQISQFDLPFSRGGRLRISDPKAGVEPKDIRLIRVHLEEDAGKSMHDEAAGKADSRIDLNRAGVPLMEIVSEPDLRSPAEAKAYLTELKLLLWYLQVSDCNMQEGSLRVDANINLHVHTPEGKVPTPIVEVKNMNSFRAVERALAYEAVRQYDAWRETGHQMGQVSKQTRGWDEVEQVTREQRSKEESSDYRYFPDPDLVPVTVAAEEVEQIRAELRRLPHEYREMFEEKFGLTPYDSNVIVSQGEPMCDYCQEVAEAIGDDLAPVATEDAKLMSNWVQQDVLRTLNERQITIHEFGSLVSARALGKLIARVKAGELDTSRGREVLAEMLATGRSAEEVMQSLGIEKVDDSAIDALCQELIAANPKIVANVKDGKVKAANALIGQAKQRNPNVNPTRVRDRCLELIQATEI